MGQEAPGVGSRVHALGTPGPCAAHACPRGARQGQSATPPRRESPGAAGQRQGPRAACRGQGSVLSPNARGERGGCPDARLFARPPCLPGNRYPRCGGGGHRQGHPRLHARRLSPLQAQRGWQATPWGGDDFPPALGPGQADAASPRSRLARSLPAGEGDARPRSALQGGPAGVFVRAAESRHGLAQTPPASLTRSAALPSPPPGWAPWGAACTWTGSAAGQSARAGRSRR